MLFSICDSRSLFEVGGRDCSARTPHSRPVLVKSGPALVTRGCRARNNDLCRTLTSQSRKRVRIGAVACTHLRCLRGIWRAIARWVSASVARFTRFAAARKGRQDRSITWSRMESRLHIVQPSAHSAHEDPGPELTRPGKQQFAALRYICECTLCAPESHTHVTLRSWRSLLLPPQPCLS